MAMNTPTASSAPRLATLTSERSVWSLRAQATIGVARITNRRYLRQSRPPTPVRAALDLPTEPQESSITSAPAVTEAATNRPSRAQIEPAALALLARHSGILLACAR